MKKRKEKLSLFCLRLTPASDTPSAPPVSLPPCPPTTAPLTPATSRATCPAPSRPGRSAATARAVRCCAYGDGQRGTRATFFSRSLSLSSSHLLPLSPPPIPRLRHRAPPQKGRRGRQVYLGQPPGGNWGVHAAGAGLGVEGNGGKKNLPPCALCPLFFMCVKYGDSECLNSTQIPTQSLRITPSDDWGGRGGRWRGAARVLSVPRKDGKSEQAEKKRKKPFPSLAAVPACGCRRGTCAHLPCVNK